MGIYQKKHRVKAPFDALLKKTATHPYIRRRDIRRDSLGGFVSAHSIGGLLARRRARGAADGLLKLTISGSDSQN
jgi:hypothetical protein